MARAPHSSHLGSSKKSSNTSLAYKSTNLFISYLSYAESFAKNVYAYWFAIERQSRLARSFVRISGRVYTIKVLLLETAPGSLAILSSSSPLSISDSMGN